MAPKQWTALHPRTRNSLCVWLHASSWKEVVNLNSSFLRSMSYMRRCGMQQAAEVAGGFCTCLHNGAAPSITPILCSGANEHLALGAIEAAARSHGFRLRVSQPQRFAVAGGSPAGAASVSSGPDRGEAADLPGSSQPVLAASQVPQQWPPPRLAADVSPSQQLLIGTQTGSQPWPTGAGQAEGLPAGLQPKTLPLDQYVPGLPWKSVLASSTPDCTPRQRPLKLREAAWTVSACAALVEGTYLHTRVHLICGCLASPQQAVRLSQG